MYRLNNLMRNVLITTDEVVFHAPTKQTLDPRTIQNCIIIAEERFIVPEFGFDLYYDMASYKNVVVTSLNIVSLQTKFQNSATPPQNTITLKEGMIVNAYELMPVDYQALWIQQLWKLLSECVMVIAYPEAFIQFGTEGIMHGVAPAGPMTTATTVGPDLKSVKWVMDKKIADRIDPLITAMKNFICWQRKTSPAIYPKYTIPCPCENDDTVKVRKSNFVLGIYDDDDVNCDCL